MLVERKIRNFQMFLDTNDEGMSSNLLKGNGWEGKSPDLLSKIVQPGWNIVEMGACIGFYMLVEAAAGANVWAVEPDAHNIKIMKKSRAANKFDSVKIFEMAIDGENTIRKFRESPGRSDRGRLSGNRTDGVDVKVQTLDTFVEENEIGRVDLIRSDIEGSEVGMVNGGDKTLTSMEVGSWIFIDLHPMHIPKPPGVRPTINKIMSYGFYPRFPIVPVVNKVGPIEKFIDRCCKPTFPKVFFQKMER